MYPLTLLWYVLTYNCFLGWIGGGFAVCNHREWRTCIVFPLLCAMFIFEVSLGLRVISHKPLRGGVGQAANKVSALLTFSYSYQLSVIAPNSPITWACHRCLVCVSVLPPDEAYWIIANRVVVGSIILAMQTLTFSPCLLKLAMLICRPNGCYGHGIRCNCT